MVHRFPETGFIIPPDNGWWRILVKMTDDHGNIGYSDPVDVHVVMTAPTVSIYKYWGDTRGDTVSNGAWFKAEEGAEDSGYYNTKIEVATSADDGTEVTLDINGGDGNADGFSYSVNTTSGTAVFDDVDLKLSGVENTVSVSVFGEETATVDLSAIKADESAPVVSLTQPTPYTGNSLVEVGYGVENDAGTTVANELNFNTGESLKITLDSGATGGTVTVATDVVDGLSVSSDNDDNFDSGAADFTGLILKDTIATGQTDHTLTFTVVEAPSGSTVTYEVAVHVDLKTPETVVAPTITYTPERGAVKADWTAVAGNDSALGGNSWSS